MMARTEWKRQQPPNQVLRIRQYEIRLTEHGSSIYMDSPARHAAFRGARVDVAQA